MARTFPEFGHNPITGEWYDSLKGDYLWSSVNYVEAAPDVMTPSTLSLLLIYINVTDPNRFPGGHPAGGIPFLLAHEISNTVRDAVEALDGVDLAFVHLEPAPAHSDVSL